MARARPLMLRAGLCLALWAGFWVLGAALVCGLAAIPLAQATYGGGPDLGGLLAGLGAALLAWGLRPRWLLARRGPRPEPLAAEAFPELHALVTRLAARVGVARPEEIRLGHRLNASIASERRFLRRRQVLELGLPLFLALDEGELASVVVHELAHQRGGDVALGAWVWRTRVALASAADALEGSAFWLDLPFRAYGWLFLRVSSSVSRAQELEADASAAEVAGKAPAWGALRKVDALSDAWDVYLDLVVGPLLRHGVRVPLADGFARFLSERERSAEVAAALEAAARVAPAPHDTHPAMPERLRAVDPARAPDGEPRAASGCAQLLGGAPAAEDAWYARAMEGAPPAVSWEDAATRVILPDLEQGCSGTPLDPARFSIAALPDLVARAGELWQSMGRGVNLLSPAGRQRAGRRALVDALTVALVRRGFAPQLRPGADLGVQRGPAVVVPARVVAGIADGTISPARYQELRASWDADPVAA